MASSGRPVGLSRSEIQVVGYLRREALLAQLSTLVRDGTIGHFWAVEHAPDEDCKKQHWHIRMTPPVSRAVNWAVVVGGVVESVPGESLPRKLVASSRAVNDKATDGLLYARHDSRYCRVKCLRKSVYDYPIEAFATDSKDWLANLWAECDNADIEPRKQTRADLVQWASENPSASWSEIVRVCFLNGLSLSDAKMLGVIQREAASAPPPPPPPPPPETPTTQGTQDELPLLSDFPDFSGVPDL